MVHSQRFYRETFAVYNVHGLIHLNEDLSSGCSVIGISFFTVENYLQILKFVRNSQNPLVQVAERISDISFAGGVKLKKKLNYISLRQKDNCFLLNNENTVFIKKKIDESHYFEIKQISVVGIEMSFSSNQYPQKCLISWLSIELKGMKTLRSPKMI